RAAVVSMKPMRASLRLGRRVRRHGTGALAFAAMAGACGDGSAVEATSSAGSASTASASASGAGGGSVVLRPPEAAPRTPSVVPMLSQPYGVFVEVSFDGAGPFLLRYDTGSPTTYLDAAHASAAGLGAGKHTGSI